VVSSRVAARWDLFVGRCVIFFFGVIVPRGATWQMT
jgi:hypothetical protein